MKRTMFMTTILALMACTKEPPLGSNPSGDTIRVTCETPTTIHYDYGCGSWEGDACSPGTGLCLPDETGEYPGSTWSFCRTVSPGELKSDPGILNQGLAAECQKECPSVVRDQACTLGRYAQNIDTCDNMTATFTEEDCTVAAAQEQELELTYTTLTGASYQALGTIGYTLDPRGRSGRTGMLWSLDLEVPVAFTTSPRDLSSWLGFADGTSVEVDTLSLTSPVPLHIDTRDGATLRSRTVTLAATVHTTEPNGDESTTTLYAEVPLALSLTVTDDRLSISTLTDPLGGTFTFQAPRR